MSVSNENKGEEKKTKSVDDEFHSVQRVERLSFLEIIFETRPCRRPNTNSAFLEPVVSENRVW